MASINVFVGLQKVVLFFCTNLFFGTYSEISRLLKQKAL